MKKKLKIITIICSLFILSGCSLFKKDQFEGATIYTTAYTIEYITDKLYGEYSNIYSIYPDGIEIEEYKITNKKINEFSKANLFVYNGLSTEKQIAASLVNKNMKMNIIDVSRGLEIKGEALELWISPSNCLMIAQNIKNGLKDHITNTSILEAIDNNYEELKIAISEIDAELKLIAENAANKTLITYGNAFDFLSKYGFEVIDISSEEETASANVSKAKQAFSNNENSYLFILSGSNQEDKDIVNMVSSGANIIIINKMANISDDERREGLNYITFMKDFIEAIKSEVY